MSEISKPATLHIRPARPDEARLIRRLVIGARLDPTSLKWRNFLVAELDGVVVGCGQVKPYPNAPELGSLVVRKPYQRRGIGGALIEALLARETGDVYLLCLANMAPYYVKFGFEEIGLRGVPGIIRLKLGGGKAMGTLFGTPIIAMRRTSESG